MKKTKRKPSEWIRQRTGELRGIPEDWRLVYAIIDYLDKQYEKDQT